MAVVVIFLAVVPELVFFAPEELVFLAVEEPEVFLAEELAEVFFPELLAVFPEVEDVFFFFLPVELVVEADPSS